MKHFRSFTVGLTLVVGLFAIMTYFSTAQDESLEQAAIFVIDAEQETPGPNLGDATPAGTGAFVLNADGTLLGFTLTYSGLTGPAVAMHFHNAPAGSSGGVVQTICGNGLLENCPDGTSGTISAVWEVPGDLLDELLDGNIYFNLHTSQNGGGEIRGQLIFEEEE